MVMLLLLIGGGSGVRVVSSGERELTLTVSLPSLADGTIVQVSATPSMERFDDGSRKIASSSDLGAAACKRARVLNGCIELTLTLPRGGSYDLRIADVTERVLVGNASAFLRATRKDAAQVTEWIEAARTATGKPETLLKSLERLRRDRIGSKPESMLAEASARRLADVLNRYIMILDPKTVERLSEYKLRVPDPERLVEELLAELELCDRIVAREELIWKIKLLRRAMAERKAPPEVDEQSLKEIAALIRALDPAAEDYEIKLAEASLALDAAEAAARTVP